MINSVKLTGLLAISFGLMACSSEDNTKSNVMGEFLPVEQAFVLSVKAVGKDALKAHWDIAEGYHLYKDKFAFELEGNDYQIKSLNIPKGEMILDKVFGDKESFKKAVDIDIRLKANNDTGKVILSASYQGCSEKGLCYPPQTVKTSIDLH